MYGWWCGRTIYPPTGKQLVVVNYQSTIFHKMKILSMFPVVSYLWLQYILASILGYSIIVGIYRVYFHPLSRFPGPLVGKLTSWYEFYYDVILDGQFHFKRQELHNIYGKYALEEWQLIAQSRNREANSCQGPIIRIRPDELHIKDSEFYDTIYSRSAKRDKFVVQTSRLGYTKDAFSTAPHDLHRSRRKAMAPFFSLQKIDDYQTVIRQIANLLCDVISQYKDGQVLHVDRMWTALTTDVISRYAFAKSMGHVESPGFGESFLESTVLVTKLMGAGVHFPWLMPALDMIPVRLVKMMQPDLQVAIKFKDVSSLTFFS